MIYELSNIENAIKHEAVSEILDQQKSGFIYEYQENENGLEIPNYKRTLLETDYVIANITKYYKSLFQNETNRISNEISNNYQNGLSNFSDYLIKNYNGIKHLHNPNHLLEVPSFNNIETPVNSKHLFYSNELIRYYLQAEFVIPMIEFIEKIFIMYLVKDSIYPAPIENLLREIKNDNMAFENRNPELVDKNNHVIYSDLNKRLYYFSYNSYTDLSLYKSHLDSVVYSYEHYLNEVSQYITDTNQRLKFYNQIRLKIKAIIDLFHETTVEKSGTNYGIPIFVRKDTLAVFKQYMVDYFIRNKKAKAMPGLSDFQDLQYHVALKAKIHVESKIKLLNLEFDHDLTSLDNKKNNEEVTIRNSKLKSNLSVPQIAYLLRCFEKEKDIINIPNKSELFRKIASSISSANQDNISPDSLKNKFNMPDDKAIEYWIEKFTHFLQFAKKERDNFRS